MKRIRGQEAGKGLGRFMERPIFQIQKCKLKSILCAFMGKKISSTVYSYPHRICQELEMPLTVTRVPLWVAKTYSDSRRTALFRSNKTRSVTAPPAALFQVLTLDCAACNLLNEPSPQAFHRALWFFYQTSKIPFCSSIPWYSISSRKILCKLGSHWAHVHTQNNEYLSMASLNSCPLPLGHE